MGTPGDYGHPLQDPLALSEADSDGGEDPKETDIGATTGPPGGMQMRTLQNSNREPHASSSPEGLQNLSPTPVQPAIEPEPNREPASGDRIPTDPSSQWPRILTRSRVPVGQHPSTSQRQVAEASPPPTRQQKREKQLEEKIRRLKTEKDDIIHQCNDLYSDRQRLLHAYHSTVDSFKRLEIHLDGVNRKVGTLDGDNNRLRDKCSALEKDNDQLRNQIASMSSAQEPLREEEYYILQFNQIKIDIDSWVAKETRSKPTEPLSDETRNMISSALAGLGRHGSHSADNIMPQIQMFYGDRRRRIALIRHIIAIVLFEKIFSRFVFGLNHNSSEYLSYIESQIYSSGPTHHKSLSYSFRPRVVEDIDGPSITW
jgi:hypothetical protein